jgi:arylsulfatase A-like enzyme
MLTGLFPRAHGVDGWQKPIPDDVPMLATILAERGFDTAAFVNTFILGEKRGFARGFQTYEIEQEKPGPSGATALVIERAERWLAERGDAPFFAFLHTYDVHSSYTPLPRHGAPFLRPYGGAVDGTTKQLKKHRQGLLLDWGDDDVEHLIGLYDGGVRQMDAELGAFLDRLASSGRLEDTLVVLTSDHGEEFLEHGGVLHGRTLHQELLRVPLILVGPGVPAGVRVTDEVCLTDVVPTALALLGLDVPGTLDGVDLSAAWSGDAAWPPERLLYSEADKWFHKEKGNFRRSVRRGRYKLMYDHLSEERALFDLAEDPLEQRDVSDEHPELVETLWAKLQTYMASRREVDETIELSDEDLEALERLGYL